MLRLGTPILWVVKLPRTVPRTLSTVSAYVRRGNLWYSDGVRYIVWQPTGRPSQKSRLARGGI